MRTGAVSKRTRNNWLIDAAVFIGGLLAAITGIYFLYLPTGGYQGGRNPMYGITILFERHTWEDLHLWGGVAMILAAAIHIAIHWQWIAAMARRIGRQAAGKGSKLSRYGYVNVAIDAAIGLGFLLAALSGVYFMAAPSGGRASDPMILFSRTTWDLIHTWSGTVMIVAAVIHFAIHWRWVTKVTRNVIGSLRPQPVSLPAAERAAA